MKASRGEARNLRPGSNPNHEDPSNGQGYANMTPASLIKIAARIGANAATVVERMMRERPHPEQGYRSAMGIIHNAHRIALEGDSMRRKKAARPLTEIENRETNTN